MEKNKIESILIKTEERDYVGVWAEAMISYPIGIGKHSRRLETVRSGGVWGIESPTDEMEMEDIIKEELDDLREHLTHLNTSTNNFNALAAKAKEAAR